MSAQEILRLIESVDHNDSVKMDEIDARVWCFLNDRAYHGKDGKGRFAYNLHYPLSMRHPRKRINNDERFTRSRDALKRIRPKRMRIYSLGYWRGTNNWFCSYGIFDEKGNGRQIFHPDEIRPPSTTEELAELHAILQAIAYERGEK